MKIPLLLVVTILFLGTTTAFSQDQDEKLFETVDEMPRYPGCEDKDDNAMRDQCAQERMLKFIYGNLTYAPEAREKGIEGKVITSFVVDKEGKVKDVKIEKGVHTSLDENAMNVIYKMNEGEPFIPGRNNGEEVNVKYTLPISFKLEKRTKEE